MPPNPHRFPVWVLTLLKIIVFPTINLVLELPSLTATMADQYKNEEQRIFEALLAAKGDKNLKLARLARECDVPYLRLRARINGRNSRSTRTKATKRLTDQHEAASIQWICALISAKSHLPRQ